MNLYESIKNNLKDNFDENFYIEDAIEDKNDIMNFHKIATIDKKTNKEVGHLYYKEVTDMEKAGFVNNLKIRDIVIFVEEPYRHMGIATQMYKYLQNKFKDDEIYFGNFTPEGKKLVRKIGNITDSRKFGKYTFYQGKINL